MIFSATVRPGSAIDKMWRGHNRRGGTIHGVVFALAGKKFVASNIGPEQYSALAAHADIIIETMGSPASAEGIDLTAAEDLERSAAERGKTQQRPKK